MSDLGTLWARTGVDLSGFKAGMEGMRGNLRGAGKAMQSSGRTMTMGLTAPIMGFAAGIVKMGADFQGQMNRVRALTGSAGEEFETLESLAEELGRTTQFSASQAADAMGFLAMAGMDANTILDAMPSTLQLAASAQLDLASAADIVTNVMTGYGMEASELAFANDVLVKSFTSANTDLSQLGDAMKFAGPVAHGMGMRFAEAAASIGLMGNAGFQGTMAGTALRGALVRLANPTKQMRDIFGDLGIAMEDVNPETNDFVDIIRQLEESGATASEIMAMFGQRAGPAMLALVEQGSGALADFTEELEEAGGTAERIANIQMEGMRGAWLRLKSAFEGFSIAVSKSGLLDMLTDFADRGAKLLQRLAEINPDVLKFGLIIALLVAAIGPVLLILGTMAIMVAAISAPILIAVAAVALLIAGVAAFMVWRKPITDFFKSVWDRVKTFVQSLGSLREIFNKLPMPIKAFMVLVGGIPGLFVAIFIYRDKILEFFRSIISGGFQWFADAAAAIMRVFTAAYMGDWSEFWAAIKDILWPALNAVVDGIVAGFNWLKDTGMPAAWNGIKAGFSTAWEAIKTAVPAAWGGIKSAVVKAVTGITGWISKHWDTFKGVFGSMMAGFANLITMPFRLGADGIRIAINHVSAVWNKIPSFGVPDWVPMIGGNSFSLPKFPSIPPIPMFKTGGLMQYDGMAYLHKGEAVLPAELTRNLAGAMGGGNIQITQIVHGSVRAERELENLAVNAIFKARERFVDV